MLSTRFTASFALLAVWCATAATAAVVNSVQESGTPTAAGNATESALGPLVTGPDYEISCKAYPDGYSNVCENWCYYAFCHQKAKDKDDKAWIVTVDRNAGMRSASACGEKPHNKCSVLGDPWPAEPKTGWSCDEQPKNTNSEGGPNAATRCMPAGENSGEGAKWAAWINYGPDGRLKDGTKLRVVLQDPSDQALCASWTTPGSTKCPAPVKRTDKGIDKDAVRQQ